MLTLNITADRIGYRFPREFKLYHDLPEGFVERSIQKTRTEEDTKYIYEKACCKFEGQEWAHFYMQFQDYVLRARAEILDYFLGSAKITLHEDRLG